MEIKIPENAIDQFLEEGYDEQAKTAEQVEENDELILEVLEQTLNFGFEAFDEASKKRGLPGLGSVPPDKLGKLSIIVAKEEIPETWLRRTPKIALASVLGGIVLNNARAYNRLKNNGQLKGDNDED